MTRRSSTPKFGGLTPGKTTHTGTNTPEFAPSRWGVTYSNRTMQIRVGLELADHSFMCMFFCFLLNLQHRQLQEVSLACDPKIQSKIQIGWGALQPKSKLQEVGLDELISGPLQLRVQSRSRTRLRPLSRFSFALVLKGF